MAVKASATITIFNVDDIAGTTRYYKLVASGSSTPSKPTENTDPDSTWTIVEPTVDISKVLYFVDQTLWSNGSKTYSEVSKSSSYEAAKEAYGKAQSAYDTADNAQIEVNEISDTVDITAASIDELTEIVSGNETEPGLAGDFQSLTSQLYGDGETDMGDVGDLIKKSNELDDLTKSLSDAQTATDSQVKETAEQLNVYKGYIDIKMEEPSITIGAGANSNLKLDPDAINFMVDGSKTTEITSDGLSANTVEITNIRMRAIDNNGALTGKLGWIARSNGHLSLKEVR